MLHNTLGLVAQDLELFDKSGQKQKEKPVITKTLQESK